MTFIDNKRIHKAQRSRDVQRLMDLMLGEAEGRIASGIMN